MNHKRVTRIRLEEGLQVRRRVEKRGRLYLRETGRAGVWLRVIGIMFGSMILWWTVLRAAG